MDCYDKDDLYDLKTTDSAGFGEPDRNHLSFFLFLSHGQTHHRSL
jgi:hypothetical protein